MLYRFDSICYLLNAESIIIRRDFYFATEWRQLEHDKSPCNAFETLSTTFAGWLYIVRHALPTQHLTYHYTTFVSNA